MTPRLLTRDQMRLGLRNGHTLYVDRKDAPELQDLLRWQRLGYVTSRLQNPVAQYSRAAFTVTAKGRATMMWE